MTRPRTLRGPWSSSESVALSSFCKVSRAFLRKVSSLISFPTVPWPRFIFWRISRKLVMAEALGQVLDPAGPPFQFDHEGTQVRLLEGVNLAGLNPRSARRSAFDGDKVLPHEPGELDDGPGVGFDLEPFLNFHRDLGPAVFKFDILDAANLDAGHFDEVTALEFLGGFETAGNFVAGFEKVAGTDHFEDDHRDHDG